MSKRKYNEITYSEKLLAIRELEGGTTQRAVAAKFDVALGTVANWFKNRKEIEEKASENVNPNSRRAIRVKDESTELDERVYNWFAAARGRNVPISGPIIQAKAKIVAANLKMEGFKASNGWLESFRNRHIIKFKVLSRDKIVDGWKDNASFLLRKYALKDVWNQDETGLFFRGLPRSSLVLASEKAKGGKLSKERLTIGLLTSAVEEKFKPIVIGKMAMPKAFNRRLPSCVYWKSNKKAWMTSKFYREYLIQFNNEMKRQKRNVALLLDNAPCHPQIELSNVELFFLPPNTTAATQPLDAGIRKNFKCHYRQLLVQYLYTDGQDSVGDGLKKVTARHAVNWISTAWAKVSSRTISKCFKNTGITNLQEVEPDVATESDGEESFDEFDLPDEFLEAIKVVNDKVACYDELDTEDWEKKPIATYCRCRRRR